MAGTMSAKVIDIRNNQPIDGASVTANPGGHTTTADDDGNWSLSLDAGDYSLEVAKGGYESWYAEGIIVLDSIDTNLGFVALRPPDD